MPAECPKCGSTVKESAEACARCGLAVARMESFSATQASAASEVLRAAWDKLVESWDDEARHEAMIRLATDQGEIGWLAGRYREQTRQRSGDEVSTRMLERIRKAGEATLFASATMRKASKEPKPYKNTVAVLGLMIVMLVVAVAYVFLRSRGVR